MLGWRWDGVCPQELKPSAVKNDQETKWEYKSAQNTRAPFCLIMEEELCGHWQGNTTATEK